MKKLACLLLLVSTLAGCATAPPPVEEPRVRATRQAELGLRRLRAGDVAGAKRAYNSASAIDPFFVRAHLGLARCYYATGELELEVAEDRKALALSPKLVLVWANLGHALSALDRLAEARQAYLQVVALGRADLIAVQLAVVERDLGLPEPADRPEAVEASPALQAPTDPHLPELIEPAEVR